MSRNLNPCWFTHQLLLLWILLVLGSQLIHPASMTTLSESTCCNQDQGFSRSGFSAVGSTQEKTLLSGCKRESNFKQGNASIPHEEASKGEPFPQTSSTTDQTISNQFRESWSPVESSNSQVGVDVVKDGPSNSIRHSKQKNKMMISIPQKDYFSNMIPLEQVFGKKQTLQNGGFTSSTRKQNKKIRNSELTKTVPIDSALGNTDQSLSEVSKAYVGEVWGNETVSRWERKQILYLMSRIVNHLKISDKEAHSGIVSSISEDDYLELRRHWELSPTGILEAEKEVCRILKNPEGARRVSSFRQLLHRHAIASNWKNLPVPQLRNLNLRSHLMLVEKYDLQWRFGMADDPRFVRDTPGFSIIGWQPDSKFFVERYDLSWCLNIVFGEHEGRRRSELNSYLQCRKYRKEWWPALLGEDSGRLGLDVLGILKVGDALQLGEKHFKPEDPSFMDLDAAFSQTLQVVADTQRPLPWAESSERAWLLAIYGDHYRERLQKLSHLMLESEMTSNPKTMGAIKNLISRQASIAENYRVGYELLWCEMGLELKALPKLIQNRTQEDLHTPDANDWILSQLMEVDKDLYKKWLLSLNVTHQFQAPFPTLPWSEKISRLAETCTHKFFRMIWLAMWKVINYRSKGKGS
ncbi:hypothetical protein PGTUg99_004443 [Puccinia graminis f. sp. tritici]|uniref:Uncharacterized protein n=1 Tax=Puccinia graminis f. sp. tritici TaxID=56615 RepID=A0A5B0M2V6_PUCGR|nr:hypothetical protein PGTUg99_004443 [Puccinia graminis f. sp. tritici]